MKLILTGATGFVGKQILEKITSFDVTVIGRRKPESLKDCTFFQANIDTNSNYGPALVDGDVVIHCAARVHIMDDKSDNPLEAFREVNRRGTINLATQAVDAGVKRFVFISSIKVGGENSEIGAPLTEEMKYVPADPYGLSKYEAEEELKILAKKSGMEVVIIRPTLVYGPGVKANFEVMMKWLSKGIPLPLGATNNKRSLVALDNLVYFILLCIKHPKAANETFFISDDNDLSTTQLLRKLSYSLGKRCFLVPIPSKLLSFVLSIFGLRSLSDRLLGSLQVSTEKAKNLLGWVPKVTVEEAFQETTNFYKQKNNIK